MKEFLCLILCLLTAASVYSEQSFIPIKEILKKATVHQNTIIIAPAIINEETNDGTTARPINGRIVNGLKATSIKQFPHQVKLLLKSAELSTETEDVFNNCGGSIISPDWILTAAHCVEPSLEGYVFVGCLDWSQEIGTCTRIEVSPDNYIIHRGFSMDSSDTRNDIALIQLPNPLNFTDSAIQPIALNTNPYIAEGQQVVLSGYGVTETGDSSDELRYTTVKIIRNKECRKTFQSIGNTVICFSANGKTSDCQGDSGGPMTMIDKKTAVLVGVTSFGGPTCLDYPGVYTRVSSYLPWICRKTGICYENLMF